MKLGDLTILLPLKDRRQYTKRFMSKLHDENCPFPVLIADGGSDHLEEELKSYSNVNYEYIRYPFDSSLEQFYKKMKDVADKIKTPYVSMQDNDDYFDIDGMSRSVEILKNENCHSSRIPES